MQKKETMILLIMFVVLFAGTVFGQDIQSVKINAAPESIAGPQPVVTGSGRLVNARFLQDLATVANDNDQVWANAFNTFVTLTGSAQCVKLSFTGEIKISTSALPPYTALIRATIDNIAVNGAGKFVTLPISDEYSLTSMNWWKCGLAPGTHAVKIQFLPDFAGDVAYMGHRTLVIEYSQ